MKFFEVLHEIPWKFHRKPDRENGFQPINSDFAFGFCSAEKSSACETLVYYKTGLTRNEGSAERNLNFCELESHWGSLRMEILRGWGSCEVNF